MVIKTSKRLGQFQEYIFSVLAKKKKEVEQKTGRKVLDLGAGSPDYPPSKIYIDKLFEYFQEPDAHMYPGYGPIPEFVCAIQNWYKTRFGVEDLQKNEIFQLNGGKDGLAHLPLALLDEGDEVLVPDPGYTGFNSPIQMINAKCVPYDLLPENNFKPDIDKLNKLVTSRTKFIIVNYPSNPTGQVANLQDLQNFVDFALEHNIIIVYDNPYSEIAFDGYQAPSILKIKGAKEIAVEMNSFSKTFSMAGYRIGWIAGNKEIINAIAKIKSVVDSGVTKPLQKLATYALDNFDDEWYKQMIQSYEKRRDILLSNISKIGLSAEKPKGALYIWAKIPDEYEDSEEYAFRLLEEKQILLTPGTAYGKNGKRYVRISFCRDIDRIYDYF